MDLHLNGKRALVTGGSRGIGFGVARLLAEQGCDLHLASRSAVVFLASDRSSYTSGAIVTIDGGFSQRPAQVKEW